jgi:exosome complex RNA-binding protein Rrp42 (RNase PH superfamily)
MVCQIDLKMNCVRVIIFLFNHYLVLDCCFEESDCGKHGRCVLTSAGSKCVCKFLYSGSRCEKSKCYFFLEQNNKTNT